MKSKSPKLKQKKSKWRPCPAGQYWRRGHFQSAYRRSDGTPVRGHQVCASCCDNPSKKDQIYSEELHLIAAKYFSGLKGAPTQNDLGYRKNGNKYDELIRGWTQFWNDVLEAKEPLDANLVKALIATESGFNVNPKVGPAKARGLIQVTDATTKILGDKKGELKDHLIHIDQKEMADPTLNIAAGTRWLFQKKLLAGSKLNRTATWDEAVAEYKSYLNKMIKDPKYVPVAMKKFREFYKKLSHQ